MANLLSTGTAFAGYFIDAILSSSGSPVTDTPVTIYQSDGSTKASLYTDQTKGTSASNPVNTDADGNLAFYTDPGVCVLSFTVGGVGTTKTVEIGPWYTDSAWNVTSQTTTYSALSGDSVLADASSAAFTVTLPSPADGVRVLVTKTDTSTNAVTVTTSTGSIIGPGSASSGASVKLLVYNASMQLQSDGTNYYIIGGLVGSESVNVVSTSGSAVTIPNPGEFIGSEITLSADCTITMPAATLGAVCWVEIHQAASGGPYTVTWPSSGTSSGDVNWFGNSTPTMTTTASYVDLYQFVGTSSGYWRGTALQGSPN